MLFKCKLCGHDVGVDAKTCPGCGTHYFHPAHASDGMLVASVLALVLIVIGGGWYYLTRHTPEFDLTSNDQRRFDACAAAFKRIDSGAVVPLRPINGELIGWPLGGDFTVEGKRTSGSCTVDHAGHVSELTVDGNDVPIPGAD